MLKMCWVLGAVDCSVKTYVFALLVAIAVVGEGYPKTAAYNNDYDSNYNNGYSCELHWHLSKREIRINISKVGLTTDIFSDLL